MLNAAFIEKKHDEDRSSLIDETLAEIIPAKLLESGLRGEGLGRYHEKAEEDRLMHEEGNRYVASVKWVFQVMEDR
jgi:hypothetical protein